MDMVMAMGSHVQFNEAAKSKYEYWQCSEGDDMCNGFVMVSSEVSNKENYFSAIYYVSTAKDMCALSYLGLLIK